MLVICCLANTVLAQNTAFTYQGKLSDAGNPANGNYDLQFKLFDTSTVGTGAQQGSTLTRNPVSVSAGAFTVTLDYGANVFDGSARYLEIGVRPAGNVAAYTVLSPRQPITATPYAIQTLNAQQLGGAPASSYTKLNASGNLGIGTNAPNHRLRISGGPGWTTDNWGGAIELDNASAIGWRGNSSGNRFGIGQTNGGLHFFATAADPGATNSPAVYSMTINDSGNVGIGTTFPSSKLEIAAQDGLAITGFQPFLTLRDANSGGLRGIVQSADGHIGLVPNSFIGTGSSAMIIRNTTGNVGIGTAFPSSKLEIAAQDGLAITGFQPFLTLRDTNAGNTRSILAGGNGDFGFYPNSFIGGNPAVLIKNFSGNVGIGTSAPAAKLHIVGTAKTSILEITGGSDLAEHFELTEDAQPGLVVAIDPQRPGKLALARGAYNRRVAGIISGANNLSAGMVLPDLTTSDKSLPVALSGRVWVYCDASVNSINPGDLLTTSIIPGHAMKVINYRKAQGAIIGKAMTSLKKGKGLVLVLVSLQ